MTTLILTEKPNVARRIASILSNDFEKLKKGKITYYKFLLDGEVHYVAPAAGHLLELDYPPGKWDYPSVIPPEKLVLREIKGKEGYLNLLRKLGRESSRIVVATDLDAEGSSIALEIMRALKWEGDKEVLRMEFSSLNANEIRNSFRNLRPFDYSRAQAGWVRRVVDLEWGANVSRGLTLSVRKRGWVNLLSSGRVQGPTLSIITRREREIRGFIPRKYYKVLIEVDRGFSLELLPPKGEEKVWSVDYALRAVETVRGRVLRAIVRSEERKLRPPPPFDGTSLQVEASTITGLTPKQIADRASGIAQRLYESGLISYIGTESQKYPKSWRRDEFVEMVKLVASYPPLREEASFVLANMRSDVVEGKKDDPAHPTVHVVGVPETGLEGKYREVYEIVARRNLATLSPDALVRRVRVDAEISGFTFRASGHSVIDEGWLRVYPYAKKEVKMPEVSDGDELRVIDVKFEERETQPPKRYSHVSLIREMERLGLGTKNTRIQIIDALRERGYLDAGFKPTRLGEAVVEVLEEFVPSLTNPELTAKLEKGMNEIELGELDPNRFLEESLGSLSEVMEDFKRNEDLISERLYSALLEYKRSLNSSECPKCGGTIDLRKSSYGYFLVCSNFPEKCDVKRNLLRGERLDGRKCVCGLPLVRGKVKTKSGKSMEYVRCVSNCDLTPVRCAGCGSPMSAREGKFGVYLRCGNCGSMNFFKVRKR
ncbi:MAG: DNA topoisomerase I [Candidatus Korarchaeum sp.]